MKFIVALIYAASLLSSSAVWIKLSDGKTFAGWSGDTNKTWRIEDGAFVGGSLAARVPRNEFLRTDRQFTNFILRLKVKIVGSAGFVNGGIQLRSQPAVNPTNEMVGYQCDVGEGTWGGLYDESRRNKFLIKPDEDAVKKAVRPNEWNEYTIRARGRVIEAMINGVKMFTYTETDATIPQYGYFAVQVHGDGVTEVSYKDIEVQVLN